jgi:hypothetical protein
MSLWTLLVDWPVNRSGRAWRSALSVAFTVIALWLASRCTRGASASTKAKHYAVALVLAPLYVAYAIAAGCDTAMVAPGTAPTPSAA